MDDDRNKKLFGVIQKDCMWRKELNYLVYIAELETNFKICSASNLTCCETNCVPFKFALFFNRPEIQKG